MEVNKCHQRIMRESLEITRKEALPLIRKYEWLGTFPVNFTGQLKT